MKTTIYVFSGTGTSLTVAKKIGLELGDTTITSIAKYREQPEIRTESERIGIIFPCYYGELPQIVTDFVSKLSMEKSQYVFSVITAGGNAGYGLKFLDELLKKKGKSLDYGTSIVIASNYIVGWYYTMIHPNQDRLKKLLEASTRKSRVIAKDIAQGKKAVEKVSWLGYKMPHIISPKEIVKDTRPWDVEFCTNDKCNGCGICKMVCPVDNIKMVNGAPEYTHNCQRCMACIQYCPQKAIQVKGKDVNKPRYFHPEVSIKEIAEFK